MTLSERIDTFARLGSWLQADSAQPELADVVQRAYLKNHWFTPDLSRRALRALAEQFLTTDRLTAWTDRYRPEPAEPRTVGVVMAGNIPAVGFHDLLCVLISGHRLLAKPSSQDFVLIQYLVQKIIDINPAFAPVTTLAERLNAADAYIATGSDNSARYFDYYFGRKPNLIRRNRTSVGVLTGEETDDDLRALGDDILTYFGLGCRNVSTLLVPADYNPERLLAVLEPRITAFRNHHKYFNNYEYNKSIYLVNGVPHYDNGFLLLTPTPDGGLVSPISVVYTQPYPHLDAARQFLTERSEKVQVVASASNWFGRSSPLPAVAFGQTQRPTLTDYADGIDTMAFLSAL